MHEDSPQHEPGASPDEQDSASINRRSFVKTGTSFLLMGACGEGTGTTALGTIRLVLTGLNASAPNGGTATATPTGGGTTISITIPASGEQSAQAPVGTYTVSYSPPANHVLAEGSTVPSTVTITEGATTTVTLALASTGAINVTVTGLTGTPTNGGTATAQRTDAAGAPIEIAISAAGTGSSNAVPTGTYSVTYTPPAGFSTSGSNPVTGVVVALGAAAAVGFAVGAIAAVGSIRITVTGLTGATSGGGATGRLTNDSGNNFTLTLPAPTSGTTVGDMTGMPAGNYNISYVPPAGFRLVNPATSPTVVAVTAGNQSTASFSTEVAPAPPAIIFHSDWSTALGTSTAARRDTNKASAWTTVSNEGTDVISAAGLDFPSANVLRVTCLQASVGFSFLRKTGMPVPNVGESRYYRWYSRVALQDNVASGDPETHPHQDGSAQSQANWLFHVFHDAGPNQWRPQFRAAPSINVFPNDRWSGPTLQKNATYRFELHIQRTGSTTFQMHVRVYNSADTLIHGDSAFTNQGNPAVTLATNPTFTWLNVNNMDGLNAGLNGLSGNEWFPSVIYMYQGCVAVGSVDWIGPYAGGI